MSQPETPQSSETTSQITRKSTSPHHIMPGLIPIVVNEFTMPRQFFTVDAVKDRKRIGTRMVMSALFHDLYMKHMELLARAERLERQLGIAPPAESRPFLVSRRVA